ncbi:MAG: DUF4434 domain-containing protein [Ekhidna sp.]|nr:DUF4434 domain-containing protein [Ekhidna sp.]
MIKGTFIDEVSHDIPHQNWGPNEWDQDFALMKSIGIEFVILIRCGYKKWSTYPSSILKKEVETFDPPEDLVRLFLNLSEEHEMGFYFGLYDSGEFWKNQNYKKETAINLKVIDEVWAAYGNFPAFKGWYISHEVNIGNEGIINLYKKLGKHCKNISEGQQVIISPYINGIKNVSQYTEEITKAKSITLKEQEENWRTIFDQIYGAIDVVAFQDGHVAYEELEHFMRIHKKLSDEHGIECWTNIETFDRDMPIKFLPIKWEKMRMKLEAARKANIQKAITFEFSHFMSPQSAYVQAGHLFNRYKEYLEEKDKIGKVLTK